MSSLCKNGKTHFSPLHSAICLVKHVLEYRYCQWEQGPTDFPKQITETLKAYTLQTVN